MFGSSDMKSTWNGDIICIRAVFAAVILLIWTPEVLARFTPYAKAISLETVPSITFHKWKLTNYRRNEPIFQLKCLSGCEFEPDPIMCFNVHSPVDGSPAWHCQADLPSHLQFATLQVICEKYESKDDRLILEGSCGLEYTLKHIPQEESAEVNKPESATHWSACQWLMLGAVIYVCCYCLYHVVQTDLKESLNPTNRRIAEVSANGNRCGKCQTTAFSLVASVKDKDKHKYQSDLKFWSSCDAPSEFRESSEQPTNPVLPRFSPTFNSRLRGTRGQRSPKGGFFKKLDRPSRCRKMDGFDPSRT